ncbi:TIR domain-containing protein [Paenibacillus rigui]|uniref:Thoeris protein ThsB TIR-like domain-containing protein n=1 Tax=Paenibacillus rigui TaxID=554312 RepID=A0A229UMC4_9BACL|nr:TIR domain-containing protein [Paenibacillus rigui]OXM84576.1 hypothetical protein CF651_18885 [Paenibacillus rigui]
MGLPRTFVGFSSTDIRYYYLMLAWKENEKIDFNFTNCQLKQELFSTNEQYIKRKCRERINMAGYYIMLIGNDTKYKEKYVHWEAEVAIEKQCTIIGVNLNNARSFDVSKTPSVLDGIGAIFVPFNPKIINLALSEYEMGTSGNFYYKEFVYETLGL